MKAGELQIEDHVEGAGHRLVLSGELDAATAPALEVAVLQLCAGGASEIVIDLKDLAFLDSTGFRAILAAKELCEGHRCTFLMTRGTPPVQKLFQVSGVLRRLPFVQLGGPETEG